MNGTIAPNEETATCFNLLSCFTQTLGAGLRTGDIVDSSMDDSFFQDGQSHIDRAIFGLAFFLVLGVILFDIATGIVSMHPPAVHCCREGSCTLPFRAPHDVCQYLTDHRQV